MTIPYLRQPLENTFQEPPNQIGTQMTRPNGLLMTFLWRFAVRIMFCLGYIQETVRRGEAIKDSKETDDSQEESARPNIDASKKPRGLVSEINDEINSMFQKSVWKDITRSLNALDEEDQRELLETFEMIFTVHGASSDEMFAFFEKLTMRFSRTFYLINTIGTQDSPRWDDALRDLT